MTISALLLSTSDGSGVLYIKVAIGLLAAAANVYCARIVFQRASAANQNQWDEFARLDHKQHQYGALVLLAIIGALGMGLYSM